MQQGELVIQNRGVSTGFKCKNKQRCKHALDECSLKGGSTAKCKNV